MLVKMTTEPNWWLTKQKIGAFATFPTIALCCFREPNHQRAIAMVTTVRKMPIVHDTDTTA